MSEPQQTCGGTGTIRVEVRKLRNTEGDGVLREDGNTEMQIPCPGCPECPFLHGSELDAALQQASDRLPHQLGVCMTTLSTREDPVIDGALAEGADPESKEEARKLLEEAGQPADEEVVAMLQFRSTLGALFSYGLSTGLLLERGALAKKLLSREAIDAVAERYWNEREFRDPSGDPPDDWVAHPETPGATPPREPCLWADVVESGRYIGDVREYRMDARRGLESLVDLLEKPLSQRPWPEITGRARGMADTAMLMERPELTPRHAQIALEVIGGHGQEIAPLGTEEMLERLTEVCPDCEGDDSGGGIDEPPSAMSTCETCVGGRVPKGTAQRRENAVGALKDQLTKMRRGAEVNGGDQELVNAARRIEAELERA